MNTKVYTISYYTQHMSTGWEPIQSGYYGVVYDIGIGERERERERESIQIEFRQIE